MKDDLVPPPTWVATPAALQEMVRHLGAQSRIAVDTESNSLYVYRERVCLIQCSTLEEDYLVDPLALADLSPLAPILADAGIEKVFHAAEYDLICLRRDFGFIIANLFDTMQAARILGYTAVGLDAMLTEKFGVVVNKRLQKANWGARPLLPEMLHYARIDTRYLLPLREILYAELEQRDRWLLAREDFVRLAVVNKPKPKSNAPAWGRIAGGKNLSCRELTILSEMVACRERIAKRLDRPPFRVMGNATLLAIVHAVPRSLDDLSAVGLTQKQMMYFGASILQAVQRGLEAPLVQWPKCKRPEDAFHFRLDLLKSWRKRIAQKMGVESDIVLPPVYLCAIAEKYPRNEKELAAIMLQSPWRLKHFGAQILDLLKG